MRCRRRAGDRDRESSWNRPAGITPWLDSARSSTTGRVAFRFQPTYIAAAGPHAGTSILRPAAQRTVTTISQLTVTLHVILLPPPNDSLGTVLRSPRNFPDCTAERQIETAAAGYSMKHGTNSLLNFILTFDHPTSNCPLRPLHRRQGCR